MCVVYYVTTDYCDKFHIEEYTTELEKEINRIERIEKKRLTGRNRDIVLDGL